MENGKSREEELRDINAEIEALTAQGAESDERIKVLMQKLGITDFSAFMEEQKKKKEKEEQYTALESKLARAKKDFETTEMLSFSSDQKKQTAVNKAQRIFEEAQAKMDEFIKNNPSFIRSKVAEPIISTTEPKVVDAVTDHLAVNVVSVPVALEVSSVEKTADEIENTIVSVEPVSEPVSKEEGRITTLVELKQALVNEENKLDPESERADLVKELAEEEVNLRLANDLGTLSPMTTEQKDAAKQRIEALKEKINSFKAPAQAPQPLKPDEHAPALSPFEKNEIYKNKVRDHWRRLIDADDRLTAVDNDTSLSDEDKAARRRELQEEYEKIKGESLNEGLVDDALAKELYAKLGMEVKVEVKEEAVDTARNNYLAYLSENKKASIAEKHPLRVEYDEARTELGQMLFAAERMRCIEEGKSGTELEQALATYKSTEIYQRIHTEEYAKLTEYKADRLPGRLRALFRKTMDRTLKIAATPMAWYHKAGNWGKEFKFRSGTDENGNPKYYTYRLGQLVRSAAVGALFGAGIGSAAHFGIRLARGTAVTIFGGVRLNKVQLKYETAKKSIDERRAKLKSKFESDESLADYEAGLQALDAEQKKADRALRLKRLGIMALMGASNFAAAGIENHIAGPMNAHAVADTRPSSQTETPVPLADSSPTEIVKPDGGASAVSDTAHAVSSADSVAPDVSHTAETIHTPAQGATPAIPKEAIIDADHNVGITYAMKDQFENNPELAQKLGYTDASNKALFLKHYAQKLGIIDENGREIRLTRLGSAYVVNPDGSLTEYDANGSVIETRTIGQKFGVGANKDAYVWTPKPKVPPTPAPSGNGDGFAHPPKEPESPGVVPANESQQETFAHPPADEQETILKSSNTPAPANTIPTNGTEEQFTHPPADDQDMTSQSPKEAAPTDISPAHADQESVEHTKQEIQPAPAEKVPEQPPVEKAPETPPAAPENVPQDIENDIPPISGNHSAPESATAGSSVENIPRPTEAQIVAMADMKTTESINDIFGRRTFWGRQIPGTQSKDWAELKNVKMEAIIDQRRNFPSDQMRKVVALRNLARRSGVETSGLSVESYIRKVSDAQTRSQVA